MSIATRNALALLSSQAAIWVIASVMLIVTPRFFGDVHFGRLSFATSYISFFTLVGLLGTYTFLVKQIARDPSEVGLYVFNALLMKAVLALTLTVSALGLGAVLRYDTQTLLLIGAACLTMVLWLLNDPLLAGLHGLERMRRPAAWSVVQQYVGAGLGLAVVAMGGSVVAFAFALVPAAAIPVIANSRDLRAHLVEGRRLDLKIWRALVVGGSPYLLSSAVLVVYGSVDMLMLRPLAGDATVGWYALAYRWLALPPMLANTALGALFPSLSLHGAQLSERFFRNANLAMRFVAFVTFPVAAGIALVSADFVRILYGDEFSQAVPLIVILALGIPIIVVDMVLGLILIASDRQRQWIIVGSVAAVVNPLLNLVAIPLTIDRYQNGAIGAAAVTFFTEIVMMCGFLYFRPRGILDRDASGYMLRCLCASAVLSAVVLLLGDVFLPLRIAIGVAVYGVASLLLGTASKSQVMRWRTHLTATP